MFNAVGLDLLKQELGGKTMPTALIDADILVHEIGWGCEGRDRDSGEPYLLGLDTAIDILEAKIEDICKGAGCEQHQLFLSSTEWLEKKLNQHFDAGADTFGFGHEYGRSFRHDVAKTKPYKGTRVKNLPYHYHNLLLYMAVRFYPRYETFIAPAGLEADDYICIWSRSMNSVGLETVICSRDKDLRQCPGWHYSWECGKQREVGPVKTDKLGWLERHGDKVVGYGNKFLSYQMLAGDAVDNIPGLPGWGPIKAYNFVDKLETSLECYDEVRMAYAQQIGPGWKDYWLEQKRLLFILRDYNQWTKLKEELYGET